MYAGAGSMPSAQTESVQALCYASARAVVWELQTNAVVGVTADPKESVTTNAAVPSS